MCLHRVLDIRVPRQHVDGALGLGQQGVDIPRDPGKEGDELSPILELGSELKSHQLDQLGVGELHPVGHHKVAQGDVEGVPIRSRVHPCCCDVGGGEVLPDVRINTLKELAVSLAFITRDINNVEEAVLCYLVTID